MTGQKLTESRKLAGILALATLLAYANAFRGPFYFDDQHAIVENPTIRTLGPASLWGPRQSSTAGRPLVNLSLAANFAAGGLDPWGYHAWNLSIHILCGLLLFGIVRRTLIVDTLPGPERGRGGRPRAADRWPDPRAPGWTAFACALLWLVHPLQTEVIDYVTQRTESMMALAYFATLYLALRGMTAGAAQGRWYAAAVASCALGMMCKESMVTAPVMVLLFDAVFVAGSLRVALRTRPGLYAGLAATWIVLAALIVSGPRSNSAGFSSGVDAWTYFLNQGPLVLRYLRSAVLPVSLVFDYGLPRPIAMSTALPSLILVGLLVMAALVAWRTNRRVAFLATWFFVTLAPSSSFVPIATEVGAERRMYLPLAALVVLGVGVARRLPVRREILAGALAIAAGLFGVLTWQRNAEYRSGLVLWQTVVDRYPHGGAHYGLAMELKAAGRADESFREMEIAAADFPDAEYALGFELASKGRHAEAAAHLRRYVQLKPADLNVLRAYNLLGRSLLAIDDPVGATAAFRDTLQRNPGNADALAGLGDALLRQQQYAEAVAAYKSYVRVTKTDVSAYFNLGLALAAQHLDAEAVESFASAVQLAPNDAAARARLGDALVAVGRVEDAMAQYRRAAEVTTDPAIRDALRQMLREYESKLRH